MLDVTTSTFQQEVLESDIPVIVDFWAAWCGPCRALAPILSAFAAKHEGKIKVVKVNCDEESSIGAKYSVDLIPTIMLFKGGEQVDKIVGLTKEAALEAWL